MLCLPGSSLCGGSRHDIFLNALALNAPMLLSSAAFITLILIYQVRVDTDAGHPLFTITNNTDSDAFYVNLHATLLILAASCVSTIAPLLSGYAIALARYPIAQRFLHDSKEAHTDRLPTPFQLTLALKLIDGSSWAALWDLLLYNESWKKRANRHAVVLASLSAVTISTIILSALAIAADTWLHIVTTTRSIQQVAPLSTNLAQYGFVLDPACTSTNNSFNALNATHGSCNFNTSFENPALANGYAASLVLNNRSDSLSVLNFQQTPDQLFYYLGVPAPARNESHDFRAQTFALQTSCYPVSKECNLNAGTNVTFDCNNATFYIDDNTLNFYQLYRKPFRYPGFDDGGDGVGYDGFDNPFYFGAALAMPILQALSPSILHDPEVSIYSTTISAVLMCNVTVFDTIYDQVEGRITRFDMIPSNISTTNAIISAVTVTGLGLTNQISTMNIESPVSTSAQDLADRFAASLSTTVLAGAAGSVIRTPAIAAQQRQSILVTRLPKVPFFFLIGTTFCFPVLGIVLVILAVRTTEDARQVRCRFSIAGVVASRFDTKQARLPVNCAEELFGEFNGKRRAGRIGVNKSISGGFEFRAFREEESGQLGESDVPLRRVDRSERRNTLRGNSPGFIC